jgi:outer membrane protein OmpA-like peptidoglycan-associated protein/opacity protein-like surface antigen
MKKIVVIAALIFVPFTTAFAYNVNDDTTVFGYEKEDYGPKPESFTATMLTGAYFRGRNQHFPADVSRLNNMWRYGVRLGYAINQNFEFDFNLGYTPTVDSGFNLNVYDYSFNGVYNFIANQYVAPYITVGGGAITFKEQLIFDYTRLQANGGGGIKFFIFKNMALAPEVKAITSFNYIHTALTASLNLTYYMTSHSVKPLDNDHDGVPDKMDKCPNTAPGTAVDVDGCDLIKDSDHDGVFDNKDRCPNTEPGMPVDSFGCDLDSDHDGVPDKMDKCPNTAPGTKVDADGCDLVKDADHDGVPDDLDKCPDTPAGYKVGPDGCEIKNDRDHDGFPDDADDCPDQPGTVKGCPDRDGDGIPDNKDKCPDQKEIFNGYKDDDGCPDDELDEFSGVIEGIFFEVNQNTIKKESYPKLNRAAEVLGKYKILNFVIEGHTDSSGSKAWNMKLSEQRAQSVLEYLRYRGISGDRMAVEAFGPTKPIADNKTKEGKAKNRRIEFRILNLDEARKAAEEMKKSAQ